MNPTYFAALAAVAGLFFCSCASTPQEPSTTTYNQQVSRQADDEFNRTLNEANK